MRLFTLLHAYLQCHRWRFGSRERLERHQQRQLNKFIQNTLIHSPYFRPLINKPLNKWAYMDKTVMMDEFDRINTVGIHKSEAWERALQAEKGEIESATIDTPSGKITVGLSSGTSGQRGMFLVSEQEQAQWAGVMLAKMLGHTPDSNHDNNSNYNNNSTYNNSNYDNTLDKKVDIDSPRYNKKLATAKRLIAPLSPLKKYLLGVDGLISKQRVALILRANSNLYQAVKTPLLSFRFFDLFSPINSWQDELAAFDPTILVAPAQVLVHLAHEVRQGHLKLNPTQVISGAEVLSDSDKQLLQTVFANALIREVYQATEGFLASSCAHGNLHLNEAYLIIEKEWIDEVRFIPIVTDFSRHTQPIVRYRLNDILHLDPFYSDHVCPCGDVSTVIKKIEGRVGDSLTLPTQAVGEIAGEATEQSTEEPTGQLIEESTDKTTVVFADVVDRIISRCLVGELADLDYELIQHQGTYDLTLTINNQKALNAAKDALIATFKDLGVDVSQVSLRTQQSKPTPDFIAKKRRIRVV